MKLIKIFSIFAVIAALMFATPVLAADVPDSGNPGKIGVGFHTLNTTEDNYKGVSIRGWTDSWFGAEGNFYYSNVEARNAEGVTTDGELGLWGVKLMAAPFRTEQSKFYFYGEGLWGKYDDVAIQDDADVTTYGAGFGVEWSFAGLPELGFDVETGYYLTDTDGSVDINNEDQQIMVGFGMHYYFD